MADYLIFSFKLRLVHRPNFSHTSTASLKKELGHLYWENWGLIYEVYWYVVTPIRLLEEKNYIYKSSQQIFWAPKLTFVVTHYAMIMMIIWLGHDMEASWSKLASVLEEWGSSNQDLVQE